MKNRKAMSAVVTSVILIALVLIALGVVWAVISNLITDRTETVNVQSKCLDSTVRIVGGSCSGPTCTNVILKRDTGGSDEISGVYVTFNNGTAYSTTPADIPGNIAPLGTSTTTSVNTNGVQNAIQAEVRVYIKDINGVAQACTQSTTYNF